MRILLPVVVGLAVPLAAASDCWAQYAPSGTSRAGGGRSIGAGGIQPGQRTFRGSNSGVGATDPSGSGAGQLTGSERFLRENRQAGQFVGSDRGDTGFVGAATGGTTGTMGYGGLGMGGLGAGGLGAGGFGGMGGLGGFGGMNPLGGMGMGMGGLGGLSGLGGRGGFNNAFGGAYGNQFGRQNQRNGRTANQQQPAVRVRMRPAFETPAVASSATSARLTGLLERSSRIQSVGPIQVQVVGQTAVLRGRVATEHDRALAQQVVLLEPGIGQVRNELVVASQD